MLKTIQKKILLIVNTKHKKSLVLLKTVLNNIKV